MPPIPVKRKDLKRGEAPCTYCSALCCRYFALPMETPTSWQDFDTIRWFMLHGRISVFVDKKTWYLVVHNDCRHLQPDNLCGIYDNRPAICREYSTKDCEYDSSFVYDQVFETPEQIEEYAEAVLPPKKSRRRTRDPVALPILPAIPCEPTRSHPVSICDRVAHQPHHPTPTSNLLLR